MPRVMDIAVSSIFCLYLCTFRMGYESIPHESIPLGRMVNATYDPSVTNPNGVGNPPYNRPISDSRRRLRNSFVSQLPLTASVNPRSHKSVAVAMSRIGCPVS